MNKLLLFLSFVKWLKNFKNEELQADSEYLYLGG